MKNLYLVSFFSIAFLFSCSTSSKLRFVKTGNLDNNLIVHKQVPEDKENNYETVAMVQERNKPYTEIGVSVNPHIDRSLFSSWKNEDQTIILDENCDIILKRDGEEVPAKVIEVGLYEIKYKKCSNLEGPTYLIPKSDVFMITYSNGSKDVFKEDKAETPAKTDEVTNQRKRTHPGGVIGLVLAIVGINIGWFLFWPIATLGLPALILGIVAVAAKSRYPEKYKGYALGTLAIIFGIIALVLMVLALLIII